MNKDRNQLSFHVGPHLYTVERVWELTSEGSRCDGVVTYAAKTIHINAELLADTAEEVLRHEFQHAYEHHMGAGPGMNDEQRAQFAATVGMDFSQQLAAAGGMAVLFDQPVKGTAGGSAAPPAALPDYRILDRVTCGGCEAEIMVGSIHSSDAEAAAGSVERWVQCDACLAVMHWREKCGPDGRPKGVCIEARLLQGGDARQFVVNQQAIACAPY